MKITLNANITPDTITGFLEKQKNKTKKIEEFCIKNKINEMSYKDSELEYEYTSDNKKTSDNGNKQKFETRPKQQTKEVRKGA